MGRESREPREIEGSRKYTSIFIQTLDHDTEICYGSSSLSTNRENPENWVMDFRIQYKLEIVQIVFFVRLRSSLFLAMSEQYKISASNLINPQES